MQNYNKSLKLEINNQKCLSSPSRSQHLLNICIKCVKRIKKAAYMFNFCKNQRANYPTSNSFTNFVRVNNKHNNPAPAIRADNKWKI